MTARIILQVFDHYQKARMQFVQTVTDLASRPHNVEYLDNAGVLDLLCPMLWDIMPSVQQLTAIALGRLANHDVKIAKIILQRNILPQLLKKLDKQTEFFKKAALFLLRSLAKHSPEMALMVASDGGLEAMTLCLEDFNPGVKEAAAWAIGYVSRHNQCLAQATVDSGAVPLLVLCLQESELCLKQISTSALCDISKHTTELAQTVVDAGAIPLLIRMLINPDQKLKRQVLSALSCIAKHCAELAEFVIESPIFPEAFYNMRDENEIIAKAAVILTKEICKHSFELSQLVSNMGAIEFLVEIITSKKSSAKLPALLALGYIAGYSGQLALTVIKMNGVDQLALILKNEFENHILAITVWTLGQIGKHSSDHAKYIADVNIFPYILSNSDDLKMKCKITLKLLLQKCMHIEALEPLLHDAPLNILKYVFGQFSKILPNDARARRLFVTTGGLKKVQEIQAEPGSNLAEYITIINCCFPEEIVRYYSPGYPDRLLEAVDQYQPNYSVNKKKCNFSVEKSISNTSASAKHEKE